jgi:hypothetical protein
MSENRNTGTFSGADLRRRMAEREAAKAAEEMRRLKEQQEKQKAVMEEFHKPPDRTPEQLPNRRRDFREHLPCQSTSAQETRNP